MRCSGKLQNRNVYMSLCVHKIKHENFGFRYEINFKCNATSMNGHLDNGHLPITASFQYIQSVVLLHI